jgi:hypothetical protein
MTFSSTFLKDNFTGLTEFFNASNVSKWVNGTVLQSIFDLN